MEGSFINNETLFMEEAGIARFLLPVYTDKISSYLCKKRHLLNNSVCFSLHSTSSPYLVGKFLSRIQAKELDRNDGKGCPSLPVAVNFQRNK